MQMSLAEMKLKDQALLRSDAFIDGKWRGEVDAQSLFDVIGEEHPSGYLLHQPELTLQ